MGGIAQTWLLFPRTRGRVIENEACGSKSSIFGHELVHLENCHAKEEEGAAEEEDNRKQLPAPALHMKALCDSVAHSKKLRKLRSR